MKDAQVHPIEILKVDKEKVGRTHLVSPEIAAASAITGKLTDCNSII